MHTVRLKCKNPFDHIRHLKPLAIETNSFNTFRPCKCIHCVMRNTCVIRNKDQYIVKTKQSS